MSRIRSKDTKPEIAVRKYLFAHGVRYRLHTRLPGRPDISIAKRKLAIFVNGCFWHAHNDCPYFRWPQARNDYWKGKIEGNIARDIRNYAELEQAGWKVYLIWECQIKKNREATLSNVLEVCKLQ
jgi:DNA mismatch endonuclease (patch repair protein)